MKYVISTNPWLVAWIWFNVGAAVAGFIHIATIGTFVPFWPILAISIVCQAIAQRWVEWRDHS